MGGTRQHSLSANAIAEATNEQIKQSYLLFDYLYNLIKIL